MDYLTMAEDFVRTVKDLNKSSFMMDFNRYSKGEMLVLNYLYKHADEQVVPSMLSQYTETSSARIATILGSLEDQDYVTRNIDKKDRRKILVNITEKGRAFAHCYHDQMLNHLASVLERMGPVNSQEFLKHLKVFAEIGEEVLLENRKGEKNA